MNKFDKNLKQARAKPEEDATPSALPAVDC